MDEDGSGAGVTEGEMFRPPGNGPRVYAELEAFDRRSISCPPAIAAAPSRGKGKLAADEAEVMDCLGIHRDPPPPPAAKVGENNPGVPRGLP